MSTEDDLRAQITDLLQKLATKQSAMLKLFAEQDEVLAQSEEYQKTITELKLKAQDKFEQKKKEITEKWERIQKGWETSTQRLSDQLQTKVESVRELETQNAALETKARKMETARQMNDLETQRRQEESKAQFKELTKTLQDRDQKLTKVSIALTTLQQTSTAATLETDKEMRQMTADLSEAQDKLKFEKKALRDALDANQTLSASLKEIKAQVERENAAKRAASTLRQVDQQETIALQTQLLKARETTIELRHKIVELQGMAGGVEADVDRAVEQRVAVITKEHEAALEKLNRKHRKMEEEVGHQKVLIEQLKKELAAAPAMHAAEPPQEEIAAKSKEAPQAEAVVAKAVFKLPSLRRKSQMTWTLGQLGELQQRAQRELAIQRVAEKEELKRKKKLKQNMAERARLGERYFTRFNFVKDSHFAWAAKSRGKWQSDVRELAKLLLLLLESRQMEVDMHELLTTAHKTHKNVAGGLNWITKTTDDLNQLSDNFQVRVDRDNPTKSGAIHDALDLPAVVEGPLLLLEDRLSRFTGAQRQRLFGVSPELKDLRQRLASAAAAKYDASGTVLLLTLAEIIGKAHLAVLLPANGNVAPELACFQPCLDEVRSTARGNALSMVRKYYGVDLSEMNEPLSVDQDKSIQLLCYSKDELVIVETGEHDLSSVREGDEEDGEPSQTASLHSPPPLLQGKSSSDILRRAISTDGRGSSPRGSHSNEARRSKGVVIFKSKPKPVSGPDAAPAVASDAAEPVGGAIKKPELLVHEEVNPWQPFIDQKTGQTYYYNAALNKSEWVKPEWPPRTTQQQRRVTMGMGL